MQARKKTQQGHYQQLRSYTHRVCGQGAFPETPREATSEGLRLLFPSSFRETEMLCGLHS